MAVCVGTSGLRRSYGTAQLAVCSCFVLATQMWPIRGGQHSRNHLAAPLLRQILMAAGEGREVWNKPHLVPSGCYPDSYPQFRTPTPYGPISTAPDCLAARHYILDITQENPCSYSSFGRQCNLGTICMQPHMFEPVVPGNPQPWVLSEDP